MKHKLSETCKQLMFGIALFCVLFMIVGGIIAYLTTGEWLQFILGIILGGIIALVLVQHMDRTVYHAVNSDPEDATKYTRKMSIIRYLVMIAVVILALTFPGVFNIFGVLLGILALKFSAYLQPFTSKYIYKNK